QGPLPLDRGEQRVPGTREGIEEAVTGGVDLVPVPGVECLAKQPALVGQHLLVSVSQLAQQASGTLDVREEEGHRARCEVGHVSRSSKARAWAGGGADARGPIVTRSHYVSGARPNDPEGDPAADQ